MRALYADLVGPFAGAKEDATSTELLRQRPSRWYLTGFLVSTEDREPEPDELDGAGQGDDAPADDGDEESPPTKVARLFPASVGMSVLVPADARELSVIVSFARYLVEPVENEETGCSLKHYRRVPQPPQTVRLSLDAGAARSADGLAKVCETGVSLPRTPDVVLAGRLVALERPPPGVAAGTKALSLFLVNKQSPQEEVDLEATSHTSAKEEEEEEEEEGEEQRAANAKPPKKKPPKKKMQDREETILFQVQMALECSEGFCARPNRAGVRNDDIDSGVLELQYREKCEYVVGHNLAAEPVPPIEGSEHRLVTKVRTRWLPRSEVRMVKAHEDQDVIVSMDQLAALNTPDAVRRALGKLPEKYESWLQQMESKPLSDSRAQIRKDVLLTDARRASQRIREGIALLERSEEARVAFRLTNQAMAAASRKRATDPEYQPAWRLFQLAFLLLNLAGIEDPTHPDRRDVELIFFPTGGGKTEAYLGVIAFTLLMRRMRGQGQAHGGLGVAVLLRYTLRLLTLDQLARATTLICALELIRVENPKLLGDARYSMGLWVGRSATPNRFSLFHEELTAYKQKRRDTLPCPLEKCPWCGHSLEADSLVMRPNKKKPERIEVRCMNVGLGREPACPFADPRGEGIPLAFVDEQLYAELPSFVIATVDKFAMMPWRGETAMLFGKVTHRSDANPQSPRFFGATDKPARGASRLPDGLLPPDVIVQDELHLISGPLGTMVGLYEVAIDLLCAREVESRSGKVHAVAPKIIASTATANRAQEQIHALYGERRNNNIFPPPGIDALETFFSEVNHTSPGRLYVGVGAPGHPLKRILLRTYICLLTAAQKLAGDESLPKEERDAAMTLVGYFGSLRELGGMRRLVEDDIRSQCETRELRVPAEWSQSQASKAGAGARNRSGRGSQGNPWFASRQIAEPLELTSRRTTGQINEAKGLLEQPHARTKITDVVLASNMISVGVDITRLGVMVVAGQPKTTSEYIQASSRVGRDRKAPGLVVTCYNMNRPRDRSHMEHFIAYHESFYRFVEAQSVTPYALRALDRGLSGAFLAAARLGIAPLTRGNAASQLEEHRAAVGAVREAFANRTGGSKPLVDEWLKHRIGKWALVAEKSLDPVQGIELGYSPYDAEKGNRQLLRGALDETERARGRRG